YTSKNNQTEINVNFDGDTVWLTQKQMSELFGRDRVAITQHIGNIFKEEELEENSVCKDFLLTAKDGKSYKTKSYNLDVIISVGYRVKSKQGTGFRKWATNLLKTHLKKGYTINERRLEQLQQTIELIATKQISNIDEAKGILEIIKNYNKSFSLLSKFDSNDLSKNDLSKNITYEVNYDEANNAILNLKKELIAKKEASELFGNQKDNALQGVLGNILQTFGGDYLYPSIEQQASNLLYLIIKNHSFSDGNKRIGAFMFIWFLEKNKHHLKINGELKIEMSI
ncbi:virulence RhuM family protein, partial [Rickettsiales bacterium]|nr:virulence RhuM family protein [Rickettsiales bacterium]